MFVTWGGQVIAIPLWWVLVAILLMVTAVIVAIWFVKSRA